MDGESISRTESTPTEDNTAGTVKPVDLKWVTPVVFVISVCSIVTFVGLILFCKCFRTAICQCMCCCFPCCQPTESVVGVDTESASDSGSAQPQLPPQPPPPLPPLPIPFPPQSMPPMSNPPSMQPSMPIATRTFKAPIQSMVPGRRPATSMSNYASPSTAPPAAKQVARTAKIIGNILALDKGKRSKR